MNNFTPLKLCVTSVLGDLEEAMLDVLPLLLAFFHDAVHEGISLLPCFLGHHALLVVDWKEVVP